MGALHRVTLLTGLALGVSGASISASAIATQSRNGQKESQPVRSAATAESTAPDGFNGVWIYNPEESLNSGNGRREDTAAMRRGASAGNSNSGNGRTTGNGGNSGNAGGNSSSNPAGYGGGYGGGGGINSPFTSLIVNERRDLVRDLLEVPMELTIKSSDDEVTFTDHLDRELTYPTTGKKKKYQLSASVFEAKAYWENGHFKKEIEGTEGFRMSETYVLSENGKRLFVIVRVGNPQDKQATIVGVNRVYDRAEK